MNFTVCLADQRSEEWRHARCGRLTGSRAADMLATIKSGEAAARRDLRMQLVCERLTGQPQDDIFVNAAMQRGIDCEPLAFAAYESLTGQVVHRSGFLAHTTALIGCSLDGHVDDFVGILECKCPKSSTHLKYLKDGTAPKEHLPQITHNLYVTGADYCDFFSWDDRFPGALQTFLVRVKRTDVDLADYESKALAFLAEVERDYQAIRTMTDLTTVMEEAVTHG
jgi:predicted phage-related endonuclease